MGVLSLFVGIREIKKSVVGDFMGALLESLGESDGESVAAVMGFTANNFGQAGETLGLGALQRVSVSGKKNSCIVTILDNMIVTAYFDPTIAVATIEKKIDTALHQR